MAGDPPNGKKNLRFHDLKGRTVMPRTNDLIKSGAHFSDVWTRAQRSRTAFFRWLVVSAWRRLSISAAELLERRAKTMLRLPSPRERALIVVIATAYILAHVVASAMLIEATITAGTTAQEEMKTAARDVKPSR
jgi:hypothetical protein